MRISLPFDAPACPRPRLAGGGGEGSRRAVGARGWEVGTRGGLREARPRGFDRSLGFGIWKTPWGWFRISAGIKERGCVGFHSDNDNPKFTAILDATGGSESEKK